MTITIRFVFVLLAALLAAALQRAGSFDIPDRQRACSTSPAIRGLALMSDPRRSVCRGQALEGRAGDVDAKTVCRARLIDAHSHAVGAVRCAA
jgi:hypothetical protein